MRIIRGLGRNAGRILFWAAWPAYLVYFKRGYGRTRVLVWHNGKLLATKNWVSDGKWSLPGGGLHKGELPLDGACRELREETGLRLPPEALTYIAEQDYAAYGHRFRFYCYSVEFDALPAVKVQRHEISDYAWLDPAGLTAATAGLDVLLTLDAWRTYQRA